MKDFREIELIGSTIRNGRIYFSANDSSFSPMDSFGDCSGDGSRCRPVEFTTGSDFLTCDIRHLSDSRIGPRKSFAAFLKRVWAKEGAKLRVTRTADRSYEVEYLG